jgi:hypothetical protein
MNIIFNFIFPPIFVLLSFNIHASIGYDNFIAKSIEKLEAGEQVSNSTYNSGGQDYALVLCWEEWDSSYHNCGGASYTITSQEKANIHGEGDVCSGGEPVALSGVLCQEDCPADTYFVNSQFLGSCERLCQDGNPAQLSGIQCAEDCPESNHFEAIDDIGSCTPYSGYTYTTEISGDTSTGTYEIDKLYEDGNIVTEHYINGIKTGVTYTGDNQFFDKLFGNGNNLTDSNSSTNNETSQDILDAFSQITTEEEAKAQDELNNIDALTNLKSDLIDSTDTSIDFTTLETALADGGVFQFGQTCPAPIIIPLSITPNDPLQLEYQPFCDIAGFLKPFIIILSIMVSLNIISRAIQ